jgi:thioredoxin-related protein
VVRKILQIAAIFIGLLLSTAALNADPPPDGRKKVKEENKAKVVYFFSKYCEYCNAMDRNVLSDKEIRGMLERDVVYLRVDADKNPETAKKHGVWGYPTTLLMESTGKTIARIPGYISKKEFKKIMQYLKGKRYKTTRLGDFLNTERME